MNDSPLYVVMEGLHNAEEFWRAANFLEDLEETVSAHKVKSL